MRKITLIAFALLLSLMSVAQQRPYPTLTDLARFSKTTTYVVLEDNPFSFVNEGIKDAVKKYWTVTPYKFISAADFNEDLWKNSSYSFIVVTLSNFSNDKSGTSYDYLNLLLGADVKDLDMLPEFCSVPITWSGNDDDDYTYKLGLLIRFMQVHADALIREPNNKALKYLKYYDKNVPLVKNKTILIRREDLDPAITDEQAIKKYYPYELKIVDEAAIIEAIESKAPETLIFHKVGPPATKHTGTCLKMLIGTDDAVMYYYDDHMVDSKNANGILVSDLKRIGRF